MDYRLITIKVTSRQLSFLIVAVGLVNLGVLLGTWLCNTINWNSKNLVVGFVLRESNLAWENTIAAWYSSMLLLTISVLSVICFIADNKTNRTKYQCMISFGWIIVSLIFFTLSLDEIGSIHESLGNLSFAKTREIKGDLLTTVFYSLVILVALFMTLFGYLKFKNNRWAAFFGFIGIALFVTIPLQEFIEWSDVNWEETTINTSRRAFSIIIEEGTEIFGSLSFIACLTNYLVRSNRKHPDSNYAISLPFSINKKSAMYSLFTIAAVFGLIELILGYSWKNVEQNDNGIYQNWFPSALAFFTAITAYYFYTNKRDIGYFFIIFSCLLISSFFGSNLYARIADKSNSESFMLQVVVLTIILIASILLLVKMKAPFARVFVLAWIGLLAYAILRAHEYPQLASLASLSLLFGFGFELFKKDKLSLS